MKNYICIDGVKTKISCETAENFKEQFGTKEKPAELRHGDYGAKGYQNWIKIYDEIHWLDCVSKDISSFSDSHFVLSLTGNLIDDLQRNREDLEEFIHDRTTYTLRDDGRINTRHHGEGDWVLNCPEKTHQLLGQMLAYAKRKEAKKDC